MPDAAGRGTRLTAARLEPTCQTPEHWRAHQGREARASLMRLALGYGDELLGRMYMAGGFDQRAPSTGRERALRLVVSWP